MAKFDPEVVLEFYANAWPTEEGVRDMRSWMPSASSWVTCYDHNSDLTLPKCQLVYAILTRMSVHVAHPLDPDKSNRALGFPALIMGLCQSFGVPVTPRGANSNQAHLGLPGSSTRRRCLLEEAT
ncbi:hypothetical protein GmHk_10G028766 [Glycine max]|nr:hypothetical protein GmHk_10G028766 [Glycine max]